MEDLFILADGFRESVHDSWLHGAEHVEEEAAQLVVDREAHASVLL